MIFIIKYVKFQYFKKKDIIMKFIFIFSVLLISTSLFSEESCSGKYSKCFKLSEYGNCEYISCKNDNSQKFRTSDGFPIPPKVIIGDKNNTPPIPLELK